MSQLPVLDNNAGYDSLQMACMEQINAAANVVRLIGEQKRSADENVLRLVEEQKREKEEALDEILNLEKQLDAKQKLEMENEDLKRKLKSEQELILNMTFNLQQQFIAKQNLEVEIGELKGKLREKVTLNKALEKQLDAKQNLEIILDELKVKLQLMKQLRDEEHAAAQENMREMTEELCQKTEESEDLENLNQALIVKERRSVDELQEARREFIAGFSDMFSGCRTLIGIKRLGEIDMKPFQNICKLRFPLEEAELKALEQCSLWQERLKNVDWRPFEILCVEGNIQEVVNENDEMLQNLKAEWGGDVYEAVTTAIKEMNEYNPFGRYVVSELWNYMEKRKATLKEASRYILKSLKTLKRKR